MFGIKKQLCSLQLQLEQLQTSVCSAGENSVHFSEKLTEELSELRCAANRHDMAIEDLLDGWEELQHEQRSEIRTLADACSDEERRLRREAERREAALLDYLMESCDQFYGLRRAAEKAEAGDWVRQFTLAEEKLAAGRLAVGLQVVFDLDVPVNYSVHEVVDTVETEDPERAGRIAEVFSCGYTYLGKTLRKAKVSAYRPQKQETSPVNDFGRETLK